MIVTGDTSKLGDISVIMDVKEKDEGILKSRQA